MNNIETGGPAFPGAVMDDDRTFTAEDCGQGGMSLRDYFAAKAMQGLMDAAMPMDEIAPVSYEMADAMLKARAQSTTTVGREG